MALVMTPIYTRVLDNNNTGTVSFNNIPQIYTDLLVKTTARRLENVGTGAMKLEFNGVSTGYTYRSVYGDGSGAFSINGTFIWAGAVGNGNSTANVFTSSDVYIPNYTSSNLKSVICDVVQENNTVGAFTLLNAGLWNNTAAITSIQLSPAQSGSTFAQNSSFSLYGIIRSGA